MTTKIAVIGAGISGLSSAVNIIRRCNNVDVTIISDEFSPNTTTNIAAGFWDPIALGDRCTDRDLVRKWGDATFKHMLDLARSTEAKVVGAQLISGYIAFSFDNQEEYLARETFLSFRPINAAELQLLPKCKMGYFFTTTQLDPDLYLQWLMRRFKENGGKVVQQKVKSLNELVEDFDIVVNCVGIGAAELMKDKDMYPIRGQVFKVHAPWIKHFVMREGENGSHYIIPGANVCVVGGVHQTGNWDMSVDENDSGHIWKGCCELVPSLKHSRVVSEVVGLRPGRTKVRLEGEMVKGRHKPCRIIHNYGHGGAGVTLHWGCAQDVVDLVQQELKDLHTPSKL